MFENPRRDRQARNFTTNVPKILDLKSSSEQMFSENWRWVPLIGPWIIKSGPHDRNVAIQYSNSNLLSGRIHVGKKHFKIYLTYIIFQFSFTFWETESVKFSLSDLLSESGVRL